MIPVQRPCCGVTPGGDAEPDRQRECDQADRQTRADIREEAFSLISAQSGDEGRSKLAHDSIIILL